MKIGYIRVSTTEQNTARQEVLMQELGVDKIYIDMLSGKNTDRPQLQAMLEFARENDSVVVESYSRLARSTRDLLAIVDMLNAKGVRFISKKENIDTTSPAGKLMLTIFAGLSQFERETLLERQAEGIAVAKAEGKYQGRKPIAVNDELFIKVYSDWKSNKLTAREAMSKLGLKPNTFYRRVAEYEKA